MRTKLRIWLKEQLSGAVPPSTVAEEQSLRQQLQHSCHLLCIFLLVLLLLALFRGVLEQLLNTLILFLLLFRREWLAVDGDKAGQISIFGLDNCPRFFSPRLLCSVLKCPETVVVLRGPNLIFDNLLGETLC